MDKERKISLSSEKEGRNLQKASVRDGPFDAAGWRGNPLSNRIRPATSALQTSAQAFFSPRWATQPAGNRQFAAPTPARGGEALSASD